MLRKNLRTLLTATAVTLAFAAPTSATQTSITPMSAHMQAIVAQSSSDKLLKSFYAARNFEPLFTGNSEDNRLRREALLAALIAAPTHGLTSYEGPLAELGLDQVASPRALGAIEIGLAKLFLEYARDMKTGQLIPSRVDEEIVRKVSYTDAGDFLTGIAGETPDEFLNTLIPSSPEYTRLLREKQRLESIIQNGGWGAPVTGTKLEPGQSGQDIISLRNRMIAMGYLSGSLSTEFDANLVKAVQEFQRHHGLNSDGVVGAGTMREMNVPARERLASIYVALERERWTNFERGTRHIWVNLIDFNAKVIDNGTVTFETRSVVGANDKDRRSPEFSDVMDHMVINPSWNVPRSIAVKEYLPQLQQDPGAVGHLELLTDSGQPLSRSSVDFTNYTEDTFPYRLKQPPSQSNALGLVKFMFPNKYNIYLHDTPAKSLFAREVRAFSHGCIRLNDPFDFAYALLAKQSDNPVATFRRYLNTGEETRVNLREPVPVHLVYRTAVSLPKGGMEYRRDLYGRDAKIWAALQQVGVELPAG